MCDSLFSHHPPLLVHTAGPFFDSHEAVFEVAPEARRLITLHLPVLHRTPAQVLVQLGDVDGSRALFVLGGGVPYPVVDVDGLARAPVLNDLAKEIEKHTD